MADDQSEWLKLPTDEKCVHKAWKARMAGYEEAIKFFQSADEKSPEFSKYLGLIKKFVTDSNAIAQEKGLEAALAFVENAFHAGRTVGEVVTGVITKCLNASRTKTKERGLEILMMYIEIDKQEAVQEELIKGLSNKQPKIVTACVQALRIGLRDFGSKVVLIKPLVKLIQKLLEDRDKNVREEGKLLVIEMYRWAGPALKPQLANLKPVQLTELEAEFEKLPNEKPQQVRFMRSQQDLKAKMEEQAASAAAGGDGDGEGDGEDEDDGAAAEMDPYELATAVDVLNKLPKEFYDQIEAKKWQERKEMLEAVHKLVDTLKIEPGDFGDLVRALKKVVSKDTNVLLVALAAKCLTGLANGIRKKFQPYAGQCVGAILEKFKEKKIAVVTALREAIDAIYPSTTLEAISEDVVEALGSKNPSIRAETTHFLARCFTKCTPTTLPKKVLKLFCTALCTTVNDTVPDVREHTYDALGTAMKVVGEKPLAPFIADLDSIKMGKIKECCEKAVLVNMKSKNKPAAAAPAAAPAKAAAAPAKAAAPPKAKAGGPPKKAAKGSGATKGKSSKSEAAEVVENVLSDEAVEEKATALLPGDTVAGLANSNWKERLASMEKFDSVVKGMSASDVPAQAFVRTITKKPGLKDTNFQVLKLRLDVIAHIAENSKFSKRSAEFCLSDIVDKVGDIKNGSSAKNALTAIAEATGLEFVSQEVVKAAFAQKNPKNQAEALNWLAGAVKEFGFKMNVKPMLQSIKTALAATNPAVRAASITVLGVLYMYMGGALRMLFEGEKPAVLQLIDAEFDKVKNEKPPAPTRGLKGKGAGGGDEGGDDGEEDEAEDGGDQAVNVADLVPRNDIRDKITEALLTQMADKNWKERRDALEKVVNILNEAGFITPNIGDLPEALKLRLADSNKILVTTTLNICLTLSNSMGPSIKKYVSVIGPALVNCCGDSKPQIRAAAVGALDALVTQTTLTPFMEPEIFSDALKQETPNLRIELLKWLTTKLPTHKKLSSELALCIPHLYKCLEDRNPDVRKNAKEVLTPFMIHTGYEAFIKAMGNMKPTSKDQIKPLVDKAREDLPAKPTKSKPSSSRPQTAPAPSAPPVDEPDDAPAASAAPRPATAKAKSGKPGAKSKLGLNKPAAASKKKKSEDEDLGPVLSLTTTKEQRMKDEKNMKVLKWNFTAPRGEFVDQLRTQMEPNFGKTLMGQLFHADFKFHIKAIEALIQSLSLRAETVGNLDLILKWFTLRFFDTNPSMLNKAMDYLQKVFCLLCEEDYHLSEVEANAFIPYLVLKVGENKDNVRRDVRAIFKMMCKVYPASKMFNHVINGLACKNTKQKTECLEELGSLIEVYGINVCQPSPAQALKLIAQQIGERDNSVRSAALNTCVAAYMILGEGVYKYIGNLNDKDQAMLEERIKRSSKSRPNSGAPAGKSPEERQQSAPKREKTQEDIKRPQSTIKQPPPPQRRKTFALDIDDEADVTMASAPKLVQHNLEDLEEPVQIPETRLRPPSPSFNLVSSSQDASSAIDLVISQITSIDIATSIQALGQMDELLRDTEKSSMLSSHVDQLLLTASVQLRMAYSKHMGSPNTSEEDVLKLYRCILATLLSLFQCKTLAKEASKDVLTDVIQNLVTILLDIRLNNLDEGPQVVRSVNVMVVKIIEKSDSTQVMRSLIKLQHDCVGSETYSKKYLELIMKCLWKTIRLLPNVVGELNVDQVLLDVHKFMEAFPADAWKDKASDTPLRTVKTLLHTLAKLKGQKIMSHLKLINDAENSEVYHYLSKVLKNSGASMNSSVSATNNKNEQLNGEEPASPKNKTPRRLSKSTHDQLAEIFKKIGSKENTREGLNALYDFKRKHPEADLEPFLKKSSQFFQTYIERGLKNIELEREGKIAPSTPSGMSRVDSAPTMSSGGGEVSADYNPGQYLERLKVLRARCGLDNKGKPTEDTADQLVKQEPNPEISMLGHHTASMPTLGSSLPQKEAGLAVASSNTAVDVADLKKRLERIKKGGL